MKLWFSAKSFQRTIPILDEGILFYLSLLLICSDLKGITDACTSSMFFGITCGLSAPYVAGQIAFAMDEPNVTTCLVGFNPVSLARNAPIENWDRTCAQVFSSLESREKDGSPKHVVLNPIPGPEPITGSSRMKGGSLTKIILDSVFLSALRRLQDGGSTCVPRAVVSTLESVYRQTYRYHDESFQISSSFHSVFH